MANPNQTKTIGTVLVVIIVVIVGYLILNAPDRRTPTEKLGDAIHDLDKGPSKAIKQLEDRTPGEKMRDAVKGE